MKVDSEKLLNSINNLETWLDNNGFSGYDTYDIRGQNWYINLFGFHTNSLDFMKSSEIIRK